MGAIVIKSHQNSTVERAWLVSQVVPEVQLMVTNPARLLGL
jgi:hypothetical protein